MFQAQNKQRNSLLVATLCVAGFFADAATAQQPTAAQQSAIKSACRSDFMAQCSGVSPGGKAALTCLQQHSSSLSSACQTAIGALGGGKSAPAATATSPATAPATDGHRASILRPGFPQALQLGRLGRRARHRMPEEQF